MSRPTDKDFDRLLRRGVGADPEAPGDGHASAEILAAWSERTLAPSEQRRWEAHFSRCDRCQEELVAFAATSEAEAPRAAWWRQLTLPSFPVTRWAIAGATAVLALSVAIRLFPEAERRLAEEVSVSAPPAAPAPAEERQLPAKQAPARSLDRDEPPAPDGSFADTRQNRDTAGRAGEAKELAEGQPASAGLARTAPGKRAEAPRDEAPAESFAATVEPPAAPGSSAERESAAASASSRFDDAPASEDARRPAGERKGEAASAARTRELAAPRAAATPDAGARARLEGPTTPERSDTGADRDFEHDTPSWREIRPTQAPPPAAEVHTRPPADARAKAGAPQAAGALLAQRAAPFRQILVASPERRHRWRIGDGGRIEHAAGEGEWTEQASGVEVDLLGGMSPMERVCWVVGRGGTILRTVDAETWRRVPSPTEADLVHVFAADAYHATVTTTSGDSFRTEDGGIHWRALPAPTPAP